MAAWVIEGLLLRQSLQVLFGFLAARKRHVDVHQGCCSLLLLSTQRAGVMQQDLALSEAADGSGIAVTMGNQGCVDFAPSRSAASCLSVAIRWNTLRTKKGPLAAHHSISR